MENDKYRLKLLVIGCKYSKNNKDAQIFAQKYNTLEEFFVELEQFKFIIYLFFLFFIIFVPVY